MTVCYSSSSKQKEGDNVIVLINDQPANRYQICLENSGVRKELREGKNQTLLARLGRHRRRSRRGIHRWARLA